jgi:TetR/AcrR family transcriptional regulator, transcriptional repressor for nem operon
VTNVETANTRERILATARSVAQTRGYGGLSFRDLAQDVGIKAASVYHYFPTKAELGAAVARRYWEDSVAVLEALAADAADPIDALHRYPGTFRLALENENRMCMCSYMAAEYDDLPEQVQKEVQTFNDVNVAWLRRMLSEASVVGVDEADARARAIFAAVAGAQLIARSRSDIALYDTLIDSYRVAGLLPA